MPKPPAAAARQRAHDPHGRSARAVPTPAGSVWAVLAMSGLTLSLLVLTAFAVPASGQDVRPATVEAPAARDDLVTTPVTIARPDGVRLAGEVVAPADPPTRALPGMVLVHGSGPGERSGLRTYAEGYARAGIVTLIYDKRSKGYSRTERDYGMLADDALAAVATLRRQAGVDQDRVGLWGLSEGGWVVPLAAARSGDGDSPGTGSQNADPPAVDFIVTVAANSIRPIDQEQWNVHNKLLHHAVHGSMIRAYSETLTRVVAASGLFAEAFHEPLPVLAKVRQPVLGLWGEYDRLTPPAESLTAFRRAFEESGNRHYTLRILPDAQHSLRGTPDKGFTSTDELAPGAISTVADWVDELADGPPGPIADRPRPDHPHPVRLSDPVWYESGDVQLGVLALFLVSFGGYPAGAVVRRIRRARRTRPVQGARVLAVSGGLAAAGLVGYLLTLLTTGTTGVGPLVAGRPLPWLLLQLLAVTAVGSLLFTVYASWRRRRALEAGERVRLGLLLAGGAAFVPWGLFWGLLLP